LRYYCHECEEIVEGMKAWLCEIRLHDLETMKGSTFRLP
jgi:hypothetical protein